MNNKGFTLIEMVIVFSIMAIMAGTMIAYNRGSDDNILLFSNQAKVIGVLQRAKSFALQKKEDGSNLICSIGVHFEKPGTMIIFEDRGDADNFLCEENYSNKGYNNGEGIETINLDSDVYFNYLPNESDSHDVLFGTPYLEVTGWGSIILKTKNEKESEIIVGKGGQIYNN
jgi:prepilin-type N-terminal cleavage/methylation domain-containing protein